VRLASDAVRKPADAQPPVVERVERDYKTTVARGHFDGRNEIRKPLALGC
jgi:hypothetical protein